MSFTISAEITVHDGKLYKMSHDSETTNTKMDVNVYVPPVKADKVPVLMFLSGLTCTPNNATEKSFFDVFCCEIRLCSCFS
ncbi:hypothetical protein OXX59_010440 [Metschnikowia pulcherrima]